MAALLHDLEGRPRSETTVSLRRRMAPAPLTPRIHDQGRGALAAVVLVVVLTLCGGWVVDALTGSLLGVGPAVPTPAAADLPRSERSVRVVQPGETYWSIAEETGGSGDIRHRVDALQTANEGRVLRAGDRLRVPLSD